MAEEAWTCSVCGRLNAPTRTECKRCTRMPIESEVVYTNSQPRPNPLLVIGFVASVIVITTVLCVPVALHSMIFAFLGHSLNTTVLIGFPLIVLTFGVLIASLVIGVGVRLMTYRNPALTESAVQGTASVPPTALEFETDTSEFRDDATR
jgi:hypothetical protein